MGSIDQSHLSEVHQGPLERPKSFFEVFQCGVRDFPDDPAVIIEYQDPSHLAQLTGHVDRPEKPYLEWTYRELNHAAVQVVAGLAHRHNLRADTRLVTFLPNGIEWVLMTWAAGVGKYLSSAQDPGMLNAPRAAELQNVLSRTVPEVVVVSDIDSAASLDAGLAALDQVQPKVKIILDDTRQLPDGWTALSSFASYEVSDTIRAEIDRSAEDDDEHRVCQIIFTSGTSTGVPKGCPRTVASFMHLLATNPMTPSGSGRISTLITTANFRAIAGIVSLLVFASGGLLVFPSPTFSPPHMLHAIETHRPASLVFIPAQIHALLAHPDFDRTDKSSVQVVMIGGDMITRSLYVKTSCAFPHASVTNAHGMSEGGGVFLWPFIGDLGNSESRIPWYAGIMPVGHVQKGSSLRIADEHNQPVRRGDIGEIHYNNISFIRNYLDNVKPEDFYTDQYGSWIKTGDTGFINEDGFVFILGRNRDIVKRAGIKITPAALESCLDSFLKSQVRC